MEGEYETGLILSVQSNQFVQSKMQFVQSKMRNCAVQKHKVEDNNCTTMRLRPGLRPGPHWGSLQRSPDHLAGKGEGPEMGTPRRGGEEEKVGKRRGGREVEKRGEGENCCHQMPN